MNGPALLATMVHRVKQVRRAQQQLRISADQLSAVNDVAVLTSVFALQPTSQPVVVS